MTAVVRFGRDVATYSTARGWRSKNAALQRALVLLEAGRKNAYGTHSHVDPNHESEVAHYAALWYDGEVLHAGRVERFVEGRVY